MTELTLKKFVERLKDIDKENARDLREPTLEEMLEIRKIYCYNGLRYDIDRLLGKKNVNIVFDKENYAITINNEAKEYISINVKSENLDNIQINVEDQRAKHTKNFNIRTIEGSSRGGEDYLRVRRNLFLYLTAKEGSWIWK